MVIESGRCRERVTRGGVDMPASQQDRDLRKAGLKVTLPRVRILE